MMNARLVALTAAMLAAPMSGWAQGSIVPAIISAAHAEEMPVSASPPPDIAQAGLGLPAQPAPSAALGAEGPAVVHQVAATTAPVGRPTTAAQSVVGATVGGSGGPAMPRAVVPPVRVATGPSGPPPPLTILGPNVPLTPRESVSAGIAARWRDRVASPAEGQAGAVNFMFGASLPSVVCSPLFVCTISLQSGEIVNDIKTGDSVRWLITPSIVGAGDTKTTVVAVKPTDAGLRTDLVIATTKRLYHIELVSHRSDWMSNVTFTYPEDEQKVWHDYQQQAQRTASDNTLSSGQNIAALDFNFSVTGDSPSWRPLRVYSDGIKTFVQFPRAMLSGDAPSLVSLSNDGGLFSGPKPQIVNYRVEGNTYVVDKVLSRAALITGVGSGQQKVEIAHVGDKR